MRTKEKNAISLIVLVITILVLTILASTVIISLSGTNIINETSKAVLKSNLATMQDMATVYLVANYEDVDMEKEYLITEFGITDDEFKDYRDCAFVKAGKVYIKPNAPEKIQEVAKELNMLTKEVVSSNTGSIEVDKVVTGLKIYGNTESTESVGELVSDEADSNYGKYKIPVKVVGKNLFDCDITDSSTNKVYTTNITETITISAVNNDVTVTKPVWKVKIEYSDGTIKYIGDAGFGIEFPQTYEATEGNPITNLYFRGTYITSGSYSVQVEYGTEATTYEPYIGKTYNIYLTEPLRKVGSIADYIDCTTGEIVRYIGVTSTGELEVLSTPVKESVTLEEMNFEGVNHIEVDTTVIPSNIEVEY